MSLVLDAWNLRFPSNQVRVPPVTDESMASNRKLHLVGLHLSPSWKVPSYGEERAERSVLQWSLSSFQQGAARKDGLEELGSVCVSSQRSLEASVTGVELNHIGHCGEAWLWSRRKVTNKMTLRPIHLSSRISEL